jgi:aminotransferase
MADRTVTINSLSKTYSVTGWRVGWAIAQADITSRIRKVHDFLTVGAPAPFQKAGVYALAMDAAYYHALQHRYQQARDRVCDALTAAGFDIHPPKGAYYIMAQAGQLMERLRVETAYQFSLELIDRTGLATVPGTAFYHSQAMGNDYVRFCFAKNEKTLDDICSRLQRL